MTWVMFTDEADFTAWHDQKCAEQSIPHPGENQYTQETDLGACWTTAYVLPVTDPATGQPIANVPEDDVVNDGLAEMRNPPTFPDIGDPTPEPTPEPVTFAVAKPLPDTYVIDGEAVAVPVTPENTPIPVIEIPPGDVEIG